MKPALVIVWTGIAAALLTASPAQAGCYMKEANGRCSYTGLSVGWDSTCTHSCRVARLGHKRVTRVFKNGRWRVVR
jgi:hypothetical protein